MVRKSVYGILFIFVLISSGYATENEDLKNEKDETKSDEKTVSKRGIFHVGLHGHPHLHVVPKVPLITKIPTVYKPIVPAVLPAPVVPTLPYHITHGGAVTTSYNANYPRVPIFTKTFIPPALPVLPSIPHHHHHHGFIPDFHNHHHHHGFLPHYHNSFYPHHHHSFFPNHHHLHPIVPPHVHFHQKPIVPVAVPVPGIRHPKYPVFIPQKPFFPFTPSVTQTNPTFVPIPVPTNPQPTSPASNHNHNINLFPTTQQTPIQLLENSHNQNSQGNWQPISMQTRPTQSTITENCLPYNYHADAFKTQSSTSSWSSNNFPPTNNLNVSGQGPTMAQQLALYQQQQQLLHDQQNSFPYPAAAETFSQNYEAASNDGNYHGLSSYQVPLGVH